MASSPEATPAAPPSPASTPSPAAAPQPPISRFARYHRERAARDPAWAEARRLQKRDQSRAAYPEKREGVLQYHAARRKAAAAARAAAQAADPSARKKIGRPRQVDPPSPQEPPPPAAQLARLNGLHKCVQ